MHNDIEHIYWFIAREFSYTPSFEVLLDTTALVGIPGTDADKAERKLINKYLSDRRPLMNDAYCDSININPEACMVLMLKGEITVRELHYKLVG